MPAKKKVIGYVRVSRTMGRAGESFLSPELQREQIEAVARRKGLDVVEVIEELDASGGDAKRPGWNRAIEAVESGRVQGIAVWNVARFSRRTIDALLAWDRIEAAGGKLYSATEDTGDRMLRTILLAVADKERERAAEGFAAATASAIERGIYMAGKTPLGYIRGPDRRLAPDPETAPVVLGVFERRAKGWSWVRLARWLGEQGHPRTESGVKGIVHNPAYLGQARIRRDRQGRRPRGDRAPGPLAEVPGAGPEVGALRQAHGEVPAPGRRDLRELRPGHVPVRRQPPRQGLRALRLPPG
jgi:DNA invertase Pin-like site-specific DNA recombinase